MCLILKMRALLLFQLLILHTGCDFYAHLIEYKQRNEELKIERDFGHIQMRSLVEIFYEALIKRKNQLQRLSRWFY